MSSTDTNRQDRDARRARHAQRVDAIRRQREQQNRPARESAYASIEPFELVASGQPADLDLPF